MSEHQSERSTHYKRAREAFDDLKIEDKALFMIEAAVSTITRGLEQAGQALTREVDVMFRRMSDLGHEGDGADAPADAPPPAAKKAAPKKAAPKKAAPKKTAAKKTAAAKKTTTKTTTRKRTTARKPSTARKSTKKDAPGQDGNA